MGSIPNFSISAAALCANHITRNGPHKVYSLGLIPIEQREQTTSQGGRDENSQNE